MVSAGDLKDVEEDVDVEDLLQSLTEGHYDVVVAVGARSVDEEYFCVGVRY